MSEEQIVPLLRSIRCELLTFYDANRQRMNLYEDLMQSYYDKKKKGSPNAEGTYFETAEKVFSLCPFRPTLR